MCRAIDRHVYVDAAEGDDPAMMAWRGYQPSLSGNNEMVRDLNGGTVKEPRPQPLAELIQSSAPASSTVMSWLHRVRVSHDVGLSASRNGGATLLPSPATGVAAALVLAAVLTALVPLVGPHGAGLTPDSATYGAAARSLSQGHGYLDLDGISPMLDFPPTYPALLALGLLGGLSVASAGAVVGLGCAVALGWVMLAWARRLGLGHVASTIVALVVALLPPIVESSTATLSEPPFILLTSAVGLTLTALFSQPWRRRRVLVLVGLLQVACLTRYLGVALVAGVALVVALHGDAPLRRRLVRAVVVAAAGVAPLGLWFVRNTLVSGHPTADDYGATRSTVVSHLSDDLIGIGGWFVGQAAATGTTIMVAVALLSVPLGWVVVRARRSANPAVGAVSVVFGSYFALVLLGQSLIGLDTDDRFMRPLAPALVALSACALAALTQRRRLTGSLVAVVLLIIVGTTAGQALVQQRGEAPSGLADYNAAHWQHSALLATLRQSPARNIIVSNDSYAVSLLTGQRVEQSPATVYDNSTQTTGDLDQFVNDVRDAPRTLVWFDHPDVGQLQPLSNLSRRVCLRQIAHLADGLMLETCGSRPGQQMPTG